MSAQPAEEYPGEITCTMWIVDEDGNEFPFDEELLD